MAVIDRCIRKLAVTPEWQMINRLTVTTND
jgi:hypothetical protein